ncbi:tudor domain-containing protein 5-like isoform X2 [Ornithodoros turicata]|uniref:tudor domain-containing protein 5-like isoform X2 n=1 Tax=Ornithodoros turicata TaxID=34597 RepID=UPI00313964C7
MTNPDIETVKAIIRALLIADKRPLPVRRFLGEYRNNEGHDLPWRAFGHSNALSFLRSITDTVRVFQADGDNYIQATVTEEVEHVQKLVSRQKDSGGHSSAPRNFTNFTTRQFLHRPQHTKGPYVNSTQSYVPKLVKDNVFRLVSGYPDGILVRDLEEAYRKWYGSALSYRLYGFHTIEDFVVGLSDVLSAVRSSTGKVKVVSRAGYCGVQGWAAPLWRPQSPATPQAVQPRSWQTATCAAATYSTSTEPAVTKPYSSPAACADSRNKPLIRSPIVSTTNDTSFMNTQGGPFVHDRSPSEDGLQSQTSRRASEDRADVPQKILDNIQKVLSEHPEGVWLMDFMHHFEHLQPSEYGFSSILDLLESYSSLFVVNRPIPDGDFLVSLTAKATEACVPHRGDAGPSLPASVVATLGRHLQSAGPQGVTLNDLLRLYEGSCGMPLSLSEHGFTRFAFVLYLTAHLPLIFERSDNREFMLQWTGPIEEPPKKPAEPACAASSVHHGGHNGAPCGGPFNAPSIPPGFAPMVAPPRPPVAAQEVLLPTSPFVVQDGLSEYDYNPVYVSQVYHPHHLYIQLKGTETTLKLEALMDELEKVYDGHYSDRYGVEDKQIHRGSPCAAPYVYKDGTRDWHRAQVTSLCPDGLSCQVLYVDYGTVGTVQKSDLRKLRNDFFNLPAQAIHAKLSHIKPASSSGWTEAATKRLLQLTNDDRTLMCKIMEKEGSTYPIFLCDTTTVPERHISDILVDEGHALALYQENESPEEAVATGSPALQKSSELPQRAAAEPLSLDVGEDFMSVLRRELDEPLRPKAVKPEYLRTGYCIKVVNIERQPYLSSANVSELLGLPSDRVLQLLEAKEIRFPTLTLDKKEHLHLFNQMASYDVPGVKQRELLVPKLTLFPLRSVNDLLNLFDCQVKKLRQEVTAIVSSFDPLSPYWQNLSDDSDTEDTAALEQQLMALNTRKIEICSAMMRGDIATEKVDELRNVEEEMDKLETLLACRDQRIPPEGS